MKEGAKSWIVMSLFTIFATGISHAAETRCGWYQNPSPGNLLLTDKKASWWITSQNEAAGPDAKGAEKSPEFDPKQFVETGVPGTGYGYGCACLKVETKAKAKRITVVYSGKNLPLSTCKNDRNLPSPD